MSDASLREDETLTLTLNGTFPGGLQQDISLDVDFTNITAGKSVEDMCRGSTYTFHCQNKAR